MYYKLHFRERYMCMPAHVLAVVESSIKIKNGILCTPVLPCKVWSSHFTPCAYTFKIIVHLRAADNLTDDIMIAYHVTSSVFFCKRCTREYLINAFLFLRVMKFISLRNLRKTQIISVY